MVRLSGRLLKPPYSAVIEQKLAQGKLNCDWKLDRMAVPVWESVVNVSVARGLAGDLGTYHISTEG